MDHVLHRQWVSLGLRGVVALAFGGFALLWPTLTLTALFLLAGAYLLVDGALLVATALRVHPAHETWILLVEGAIGVLMGIAVLFFTPLSPALIGYWLAVWAFATGLLELLLAYRMRRFAFSGPYWALGAAISILLGALLFLRPDPVVTTLVLLLGLYALVLGVALVGLAWAIRRVEKRLRPNEPPHGPTVALGV